MSRRCFERFGPYPDSFMEDNVLAERVRAEAAWILLPSEIVTSPRRFLAEGLLPRQILNAVLMNLFFIRRLDLLSDLEGTYRRQGNTSTLDLSGFLPALRERVAQLPEATRRALWQETGSYVRSQAWQVAFFIDVLMGRENEGSVLKLHDRIFNRVTDNALGRAIATLLARCFFGMISGGRDRRGAGIIES